MSLLGLRCLAVNKIGPVNKTEPVEHLPDTGSALRTFNTFSVLTAANSWYRASAQEMRAVVYLLSFFPILSNLPALGLFLSPHEEVQELARNKGNPRFSPPPSCRLCPALWGPSEALTSPVCLSPLHTQQDQPVLKALNIPA